MRLRTQEKEVTTTSRVAHKNYASFLRQKVKIIQLREGDDNTKIFHQSIKLKRTKNIINTIRKEDGTWVHNSPEVMKAFLDFYHDLLGSRKDTQKIEAAIIAKGKFLNDDQQALLKLNFNTEEIKYVLFSFPDDKSPGLDDFTSRFIKKSWSIVGGDIVKAIQELFRVEKS